jgi:PAS domain-containing protein
MVLKPITNTSKSAKAVVMPGGFVRGYFPPLLALAAILFCIWAIASRGPTGAVMPEVLAASLAGFRLLLIAHRQHRLRLALVEAQRQRATLGTLQESETKYRLLADHTSDMVFWLGPDRRFRYVSPACKQITG